MDRKDSMFHEFRRNGASQQQLELIAKTLASSPKLNRDLTEAIRTGEVAHLGYVAEGSSAYGSYNSTYRTLNLNADVLDRPATRRRIDNLAYVMGHEVSHAMQRTDAFATSARLNQQAWELAQSDLRKRDYTSIVADYLQSDRRQEALAELNGMNTLADRISADGSLTRASFAARADEVSSCVTGTPPTLDPRVRLDLSTGTFPVDPANLDAVATCFYDAAREKGEDYRYEAAAHAISVIAQKEFQARWQDPGRTHTGVELDFKALGLDPHTLRMQTFDLGPRRDGPFYLVDTSSQPRQIIEIHHPKQERKQSKHLHAPAAAQGPAREPAQEPAQPAEHHPRHPGHPDHRLYRQASEGVAALDRAAGKAWDAGSERLAASLLVLAKENGLQRIDHVVLSQAGPGLRPGENVFVVQGELHDPAHLRAHMKTEQALAAPVEASLQRLEAVNQRISEQQRAAQQQALAPVLEPDRPAMSR